MDEFNSDDHYIYYCGQEYLRKIGIALIVSKRVWNAVLGFNLKKDRIISVLFQGKALNVTVIQVYAPNSDGEENEHFCDNLQDFLELAPPKNVIFIIGTEMQK